MFRSLIVAGLALAVASSVHAVPMTLSHQGRVFDDEGMPLTGVHSITFRILDDPTGGSVLWSEAHNLDLGTDGIFDAILGKSTSLSGLAFDEVYWLETEVDGQVLAPRTELTSVPYSLGTEIRPNTIDENALTFDPATQVELDVLAAQLQAQLSSLQAQVDALEAAAEPQILGTSANTSTGNFSFGGRTGLQAATAMCEATYSDPGVHMCSLSEIQVALSLGNVGNISQYDRQRTWTVHATPRLHNQDATWNSNASSLLGTCHTLLYFSGHVSTGSTVTVDSNLDAASQGQGASYYVNVNVACASAYRVLCCR